jgi:thiamine biosynthesis lipoprotein
MGATSSWAVWGLEASIAVDNPAMVSEAEHLMRGVVAQVDDACSRFRTDSELMRLRPALAGGAEVGPLLASLVESALDAAHWTDGDVDPTLGNDMESLGYDRDIVQVRLEPEDAVSGIVGTLSLQNRRTSGWRQVELKGQKLTVPRNVQLDLGATAKAVAADRAASLIFDELGCGVLVSLGGDIATAGSEPEGGWQVLVQDLPEDPRQQVTLRAGHAMATSSTQKRRWKHDGLCMHHILDPRFGLPAEPVWRSVTVAASSCLLANAYSTAGIVRGFAAVAWFESVGVSGRLVDRQGRVVATGGWPREDHMMTGLNSNG